MKSPAMERYERFLVLAKALVKAQAAVERAGAARYRLPPGSPRARVTSANARHAREAEARDRTEAALAREVLRQERAGRGTP